jgi:hypothetical protein
MPIRPLILLLCLTNFTACTLTGMNADQPPAEVFISSDDPVPEPEERIFFREELALAREDIKEELREMILEEILPEIWTAHQNAGNKEIKDSQIRALKSAKEKIFLGRVEWITFRDPEFSLQARVDTGAKTCSIHAENIKEMTINGEPFVQFETVDDKENRHTLVRRIVATTKVKNTSGKVSSRHVIRMTVQLGNNSHDVNVNLNDRDKMTYNFLIGRNLLLGNYLVDVSESHLLGERQ